MKTKAKKHGGKRSGAGRPRKKRALTTNVTVKLDSSTAERLRARADDEGTTVGELVRAAVVATYDKD